MQIWRWDQGRLEYFRFENIQRIARCLVSLEGASLTTTQDPLRVPLEAMTGLPFAPEGYKVWRNYGRVFECCLLATQQEGHLALTEIGKWLASAEVPLDIDEYLSLVFPRFCYPFPAFQGYTLNETPVFPFCAALKRLLAALSAGGETSIGLDDVFALLIGNACTGEEALEYYRNLRPTALRPLGDQKRQVREMLIFASQSSFLKWHRNRLFLDVLPGDTESVETLERMSTPRLMQRSVERATALLWLSRMAERPPSFPMTTTRKQPADVVFTEGKRVRMTHLRIERSPYLRTLYFSRLRKPYLCDMCTRDMGRMYPWTENLLEIHHLLPLSSTLTITGMGTSLEDIVALCPNCHRSIHAYYKVWLNKKVREDFRSKEEAYQVYAEAKQQVRQ